MLTAFLILTILLQIGVLVALVMSSQKNDARFLRLEYNKKTATWMGERDMQIRASKKRVDGIEARLQELEQRAMRWAHVHERGGDQAEVEVSPGTFMTVHQDGRRGA